VWDIATGNCKQTIQLPRTVWAVTQNGLGDLLVGTEDYKVRTFTREASRIAQEKDLTEFEEELKSRTKQVDDASQFDNAPDESQQATMRGKTEGDIQVFKSNGVPSAFMWKTAEQKWEYVGEVVDPNAGGGGGSNISVSAKQYEGDFMFPAGQYDHVFDVELGDGIMRKLPFNNGGNALDSAEKFICREGLSKSNVD